MKKTLIVALAMAIVFSFSACKKEIVSTVEIPTTLKKDETALDKSIPLPQTTHLLFTGIFSAGSIDGLCITGANVLFIRSGDAAAPAQYATNVYFVLEDAGAPIYTSEVKPVIPGGIFSFNQFVKNVVQGKKYAVKVYGDISAGATNGTGSIDGCTLQMQLVYTGHNRSQNTVSYFETEIITGQKTIFSGISTPTSLVLTSNLDAATPVVANVLDNQEIPLIAVNFLAIGGAPTITREYYKFSDPQVTSSISMLKMYDIGGVLLGSTTISNGSYMFNQSILVSTARAIVLKAVVGSVNETVSGRSFALVQDKYEYVDGNNVTHINDTDIVGKDQYVFAALPQFTSGSISSAALVDSTIRDLSSMTVSSTRTLGIKSIGYEIKLNDPNNNNTLLLKEIKLFEGNVDVTSQYLRTKQDGQLDSIFTESDTKLYFTKNAGNGETAIAAGTPKSFTLKAKIIGFSDPLQSDNITIEFLGDNTSVPFDYRYVNTGGSAASSKLFNSNNPSSSAAQANLSWTDHSAGVSHSSATGISTPDHFNGKAGKGIYSGSGRMYLYQ